MQVNYAGHFESNRINLQHLTETDVQVLCNIFFYISLIIHDILQIQWRCLRISLEQSKQIHAIYMNTPWKIVRLSL